MQGTYVTTPRSIEFHESRLSLSYDRIKVLRSKSDDVACANVCSQQSYGSERKERENVEGPHDGEIVGLAKQSREGKDW